MADNFTRNKSFGPDTVTGYTEAADDVASVWYPIIKLAFGALDSVTLVSGAAGLPIDIVGNTAGVGGGTAYTEDAAAAADPVAPTLILIRRDTPSITEVSADGDNVAAKANSAGAQYVELLSGAAKVGGDATNGLDVDVTRVSGNVAVTLAAAAGAIAKAEDVASADADVGVPAMAVRKATPANTSGTDGDYEMLQMSAGRLWASTVLTDGTTTVKVTTATATLSNVTASVTNVTLLSSNTARLGVIIVNDSTSILYVKFGATATSTSFTYKLAAGDQLELMTLPIYTGIIDGIWVSANGAARVSEIT